MSARDTENVPPREREHRRSQTAPGVHHRESSAAAAATKNPQIPLPPPDGHNHHTMSTSVASCRCRNVKPVPSARAHKHTHTHTHTCRHATANTADHGGPLSLSLQTAKGHAGPLRARRCVGSVCARATANRPALALTPHAHTGSEQRERNRSVPRGAVRQEKRLRR